MLRLSRFQESAAQRWAEDVFQSAEYLYLDANNDIDPDLGGQMLSGLGSDSLVITLSFGL